MRPATRISTLTVRATLGLVALYVLDDAFLHREAGVPARDHIVSAAVPLGALLLVGLAYPRSRAGARGTIAILSGVLAIVAGAVDGVAHVVVDRLGGDDVTALVAGVAGGVLVAVGVITMWRGRRLDERRARRYVRRALLGVVVALAAAELVYPVALGFVATHTPRQPVGAAALGRPVEDVTVRTRDGLRLRGSYVASRNGAAILVFPGRRAAVARHARLLVGHGYGVLLLDRRGEGESEGDPNLLGWHGDRDVTAAVAYLAQRRDVRDGRVGGLGLSVGGEMLLQAAAESTALRAVVSEGAGTRSLREALHEPGAKRWLPVGGAAFWAMATMATAVFSGDAPPTDLGTIVARIDRPALFIHAARSGAAGEDLNPLYGRAAGGLASVWRVPGAGHTGGLSARPREYERRVTDFFDRALLGRAPEAVSPGAARARPGPAATSGA